MAAARSYDALEEKVRSALGQSEMPVRKLADQTGISKTHLANFKNEKRKLSFQNLDTLARYFGIRYMLKNF